MLVRKWQEKLMPNHGQYSIGIFQKFLNDFYTFNQILFYHAVQKD